MFTVFSTEGFLIIFFPRDIVLKDFIQKTFLTIIFHISSLKDRNFWKVELLTNMEQFVFVYSWGFKGGKT